MGADLPLILVKINVKSDFQSKVEPIPAVDSIPLWIRIQGIPIPTLFTLIPTPIPSPAKNGIITALVISLVISKNWLPTMKAEKCENCLNKMSLTCCRWASLSTPGTGSPLSHSGWENSIFSLLALWGTKNWPPV